VDLSHPPRFRCQCCGAEKELDLPLHLALVARMSQRFERQHVACEVRANG
jgi:hypothetical protein